MQGTDHLYPLRRKCSEELFAAHSDERRCCIRWASRAGGCTTRSSDPTVEIVRSDVVSIFSPLGASTSVPKLMAAIGGFFSITRLLASFSRRTSCLRDRIDHYRDRIHPHSSWPGRNGSFFGPPSRVAARPLVGRFATQQSGPLAAPLSGRQCCSSSPLVTVNPVIPGL